MPTLQFKGRVFVENHDLAEIVDEEEWQQRLNTLITP